MKKSGSHSGFATQTKKNTISVFRRFRPLGAVSGPRGRRESTQDEKPRRMDPGRGPGTDFEPISSILSVVHVEVQTSRVEVRGFLAFGGPRRRQGWTRRENLVSLDPGRGLGTHFQRILARGRASGGPCKETPCFPPGYLGLPGFPWFHLGKRRVPRPKNR